MKRVIITGFEPFADNLTNPTQTIIEKLKTLKFPQQETIPQVLPVTFNESFKNLSESIKELSKHNKKIDAIIMLGLAENRTSIQPEKIAINWIEARIADNNGEKPKSQKIVENAPDGIFTNFSMEKTFYAAKNFSLPSTLSFSAGTYVCNFLYFQVLYHYPEIPAIFIHFPQESVISCDDGLTYIKNLIELI